MTTTTLTVPLYNESGDIIGNEIIAYTEVREYYNRMAERRITVIEFESTPKAHSDDVSASLDLIYGYFKWEMV